MVFPVRRHSVSGPASPGGTKQATSTSCPRSRYASSAADLIVPPLRGSPRARGVTKSTRMSARAFGERPEREDHRGADDPGQASGLQHQAPYPFQPDAVEEPRSPAQAAGPHVEGAAGPDRDPDGGKVSGVTRDPAFLLRSAQADEEDRRGDRADLLDDLGVASGGTRQAVLIDGEARPHDLDAQTGQAGPPARRGS